MHCIVLTDDEYAALQEMVGAWASERAASLETWDNDHQLTPLAQKTVTSSALLRLIANAQIADLLRRDNSWFEDGRLLREGRFSDIFADMPILQDDDLSSLVRTGTVSRCTTGTTSRP